ETAKISRASLKSLMNASILTRDGAGPRALHDPRDPWLNAVQNRPPGPDSTIPGAGKCRTHGCRVRLEPARAPLSADKRNQQCRWYRQDLDQMSIRYIECCGRHRIHRHDRHAWSMKRMFPESHRA